MRVLVMDIRKMGMLMANGRMTMKMSMRLGTIPFEHMMMLVMIIMSMGMIMF
jgi:hypothetical protein